MIEELVSKANYMASESIELREAIEEWKDTGKPLSELPLSVEVVEKLLAATNAMIEAIDSIPLEQLEALGYWYDPEWYSSYEGYMKLVS
jgi:FtsZ-binding cell division protein ZapB